MLFYSFIVRNIFLDTYVDVLDKYILLMYGNDVLVMLPVRLITANFFFLSLFSVPKTWSFTLLNV